jgi:hypothetical protein
MYRIVSHRLSERQIVDVPGLGKGRQQLPHRALFLASRSPALKQAKNNRQDKIAIGAQSPSPLLPIGIFPRERKSFWPAISLDM